MCILVFFVFGVFEIICISDFEDINKIRENRYGIWNILHINGFIFIHEIGMHYHSTYKLTVDTFTVNVFTSIKNRVYLNENIVTFYINTIIVIKLNDMHYYLNLYFDLVVDCADLFFSTNVISLAILSSIPFILRQIIYNMRE